MFQNQPSTASLKMENQTQDLKEKIKVRNPPENCDQIVIHPDKNQTSDSDNDNELEFLDALETNYKSGIVDKLTDIKLKQPSGTSKLLKEESGPQPWKDDDADLYRYANDHEQSENELNDVDLKDLKEEELKRKQESEEKLSDEAKQV